MSSSFDVKSIPLHRQIALGGGLLLFIVLFFPWVTYGAEGFGGSVNGWNGIGGVAGFLVIVLVAWEILRVLDQVRQVTVNHDLVTAGLAGAVAVFGLIQFIRSLGYQSSFTSPGFGAFLILLVSIGLGYSAFLAFNAAGGAAAISSGSNSEATPPPPGPSGSGESSGSGGSTTDDS